MVVGPTKGVHPIYHSTMPARKRRSIVNTEDSEDIFSSQKRKKTVSNKDDERDDVLKVNSLFGELVNKAGYILRKGDQPNLLSM